MVTGCLPPLKGCFGSRGVLHSIHFPEQIFSPTGFPAVSMDLTNPALAQFRPG